MKDTLLKLLYQLGVPGLLRLKKKGTITVLCLHRISNDRDFFFDPIKVETFKLLVDYLAKHYTITSFSAIEEQTALPKLILSFDDGYYDFIENALPILKAKGIPCNHNIVNACANDNTTIWTQRLNDVFNHLKNNQITNDAEIAKIATFENNWTAYYLKYFQHLLHIERGAREQLISALMDQYQLKSNYRMMNWEEVKYISDNDVEIGSHTYNHDSLSTIKDDVSFRIEINKSIAEMSNKIGKKVDILSLPNGVNNPALLPFIKEAEVKYVLLVDDKTNPTPITQSPGMISRIYLMDNAIHETILRTELFHSMIRK